MSNFSILQRKHDLVLVVWIMGLILLPLGRANAQGICNRTPQVRDAILSITEISDCEDVTEADLAVVTALDLRYSRINKLEEHDFSGLGFLERLRLGNNGITSLPEQIFNGLDTMRILELHNNALTTLPEGVFRGLKSLRILDLESNKLNTLPEGIFTGLTSIQTLNLRSNALTTLPEGIFRGLTFLELLQLYDNSLVSLPPGIFSDLRSVRRLELGYNSLTSIPGGLFSGLMSLVTLWLNNNSLSELDSEAFVGLDKLQALILAGNPPLRRLPRGVFDDVIDTLGGLDIDSQLKATVQFDLAGQTASEGDTVKVEITLTRPLPVALRVPYAVRGSTTTDDYAVSPEPGHGVLFLAGETKKEVYVTLLHDSDNEDETIELIISWGRTYRSDGTGPPSEFGQGTNRLFERSDVARTHTVIVSGDSTEPTPAEGMFVPVILSSGGANNAFYTSELTLTNRESQATTLDFTYTAFAGGGSGAGSDVLGPGQQKIVPDAIEYLRNLGLPIPASGGRIGTLGVKGSGGSEVGVLVRTTTAVPGGRAGLAYPGVPKDEGFREPVYLCGLRQNSQDRSNVAFQNIGEAGDGPVTLRTTVFSGDPADSAVRVLGDVTLGPGEFHQFSGVLGRVTNGYVKVERVSRTGVFYAYAVINDQANSDGSFVFPITPRSLAETKQQTLPVIVEAGVFSSELTVTNFSSQRRNVEFDFVADEIEAFRRTASFYINLAVGEQVIIPNIIDRLRQVGVEGLGSGGQALAGAVFATNANYHAGLSGTVIGARTGSSGGGGQYSVFYNAVPYGSAFTDSAWVDALQQNEENRSNLALVNTGEVDSSDSVFSLDIYDGQTGVLVNTVTDITVSAWRWHQINRILGSYAPGTTQGYVQIRKVSGNNPFLGYGVINDGGAPGQRSGDGAYVPARE